MNSSKHILITGATGFIGKEFIQTFSETYQITALVRQIPKNTINTVRYIEFDMNSLLNSQLLKDIDVIIHFAHDFENVDVNVTFAQKLKRITQKRVIFLSSFSAIPPLVDSSYAKAKVAQESVFKNDTIIRAGLVIGNGGLYQKIYSFIKKYPFVPLVNGGKQKMQLISIKDLIKSIGILIENEKTGIYHIAHPTQITYKYFVWMIAKSLHKKVLFLPIPVFGLMFLAQLKKIMPRLPISEDNIKGLLATKIVDNFSDYQLFCEFWSSPETILNQEQTPLY
jgi:nucleoside-diphosphate-sugar epimerase